MSAFGATSVGRAEPSRDHRSGWRNSRHALEHGRADPEAFPGLEVGLLDPLIVYPDSVTASQVGQFETGGSGLDSSVASGYALIRQNDVAVIRPADDDPFITEWDLLPDAVTHPGGNDSQPGRFS